MSPRPLRATNHCRHYSYERGPKCARGLDFAPGDAVKKCMPLGDGEKSICPKRQEYTEQERQDWDRWQTLSLRRLSAVLKALPAPIPERTSGSMTCPNCGGVTNYSRWVGGAALSCAKADCVSPVRFSIAPGAEWPAPERAK